MATEGLEVSHRKKEGKAGGFRHIIYLAAFAIPVRGLDLLTVIGGKWPDWQIAGQPYTKVCLCYPKTVGSWADAMQNNLITPGIAAKHSFYNDLTDSEAQKHFEILLPHSQDAFETPVHYIPADIKMPKTYIICENDQALPAQVQKDLASKTLGMHIETLNTGHSPFLSEPDKCTSLLVKIVEDDRD